MVLLGQQKGDISEKIRYHTKSKGKVTIAIGGLSAVR